MTWTVIVSLAFSLWAGPTWYSWDWSGRYILPRVWVGPGESPGFVAWQPGYGIVLGWYWGPRLGCPLQGCAGQTNRSEFVELIDFSSPVQVAANRTVRMRWLALAGHEIELAATAWQSFGYGMVAEHRLYSCPAQRMPINQWVWVGCDLFLPTVEGLLVGTSSYTGFGLALTGSFQDTIQIQHVEVWQGDR